MLRPNGAVHWQINMAMYLHRMGCRGPFEVGDSLVTIDHATEHIIVIARRKWDGGPAFWKYHRGLPAGVKEVEDVMGRPKQNMLGSLMKFETDLEMLPVWIPQAEKVRRWRGARWPFKGEEDPVWWRAPRMVNRRGRGRGAR